MVRFIFSRLLQGIAVILGVLLLWRLGRWVIGKFKPAQVAA
jgi:hypothetical protein